jgi:hypothetical protein
VLRAYYRERELMVSYAPGSIRTYAHGQKTLRFVRCAICGCLSHWERIPGRVRDDRTGINARNFEPDQIGPARIRFLDGAVTERYLD